MPKFECWEFKGRGDPFFGGTADDRVLHRLPDGSLRFVRCCDVRQLGAVRAVFESREAAETAGIAVTERNGLISGIEARA